MAKKQAIKYYSLLYSAAKLSESTPSKSLFKPRPIDNVRSHIALIITIIVLIPITIVILSSLWIEPIKWKLWLLEIAMGIPLYLIGLQLVKRVLASDTLIAHIMENEEARVESIKEQKRIYTKFVSACSTIFLMLVLSIGLLY